MTYISLSHLYVSLLCSLERQAPIRRDPLSSDNSCSADGIMKMADYCVYLAIRLGLPFSIKTTNNHIIGRKST